MSQSIRISSGLSPILQRIPNNTSSSSSSSCMEVGFPLSSVKECRKRAAAAGLSMVSNRSHPRFLPCCAATMNSSNVDDEGDTSSSSSSKGKYDPPKAWRTILSNFRLAFGPPQVTKRAVVLMIRMDLHDPIDGLKVLLDASRAWRILLSLCIDELHDPEGFDDYGESYLDNARKEGGTNKRKHNFVISPPSRLITRVMILRTLADLNDPYNGLDVLLGALEEWRALFSSNELNDSEGYLQKEIFAIRDLSQRVRIFVSNDEAKNHLPQLTHVMDLLKLMLDNFEDPSDAVKAMKKASRYVALKIPLAFLLEGTNVEQGISILKESIMALISAEDLDDAAVKVVEAVDLDDEAFEAVKVVAS